MRKITFLVILFTFISHTSNAQKDYLKKIAEKSCECVKEKQKTNPNLTDVELGLCLLESAKDYKEQILKDYNVDLETMDGENGEKLGELIGYQMAFACPDVLQIFADDEEALPSFTTKGQITNIVENAIITFELKDDSGKTTKLYWLTFIQASFDIQNTYKKLQDKNVEIEYFEQELFDPRLNEYRKFNVISAIRLL